MPDIIEIEPGLWQGADPGMQLPHHIRFVVDLRDDQPPRLYHDGIRGILWMPARDGYFPSARWLDSVVDYVIAARKDGHEVLIHCAMGISRSALVCAAVLMKLHQLSPWQAKERLREKHPAVNPAPCYDAALLTYDRFLAEESWTELG